MVVFLRKSDARVSNASIELLGEALVGARGQDHSVKNGRMREAALP